MKALTDLFSTDYGLMSIVGIAMMIVGIITFTVVLRRKMNEKPSDPFAAKDKKPAQDASGKGA